MSSIHDVKTKSHGMIEILKGGLVVLTTLAAFGLVTSPAFAGDVGALIEFQPQTPANAADVNKNFDDVKTAVNSKTTTGIEFATSDSSVQIVDTSATPTVVQSVTVSVPGPGFVEVEFDAYLSIGHTKDAGNSYAVCSIKTDTTSPDSSTNRLQGTRRFIVVLSAEITGSRYPHISTAGVHPVSAAGSVTFNVVCYRNSTSTSGTAVYRALRTTYQSDRY